MKVKRLSLILAIQVVVVLTIVTASAALARGNLDIAFQSQNSVTIVYTGGQEQADLAAVELATQVDSAGYGLLPASEWLGGERDVALAAGMARVEWDGPEADPTALDYTGLGGLDLTVNGNDHFLLSLTGGPFQATLTVYSGPDAAASYSFSSTGQAMRLPFAAFSAAAGAGADFQNVGAIILEVSGDLSDLAVSDLGWASPLQVSKSSLLIVDGNSNGRADAGDVAAYSLAVTNSAPESSAAIRLLDALPRSQALLAGSLAVTHGQAQASGNLIEAAIGTLAAGETAVLTYRGQYAPEAIVAATLVTQDGDTPPGGGGNAVTILSAPFTDGNGNVGFTGAVDNGGVSDYFVWYDSGITFLASTVVSPTLTGAESTMGVGNAGEFIYSPSAGGDDAVWTHNGLLLRDTTQAPGFPAGTTNTFNSRPTMDPSGTAYWISGFDESGGSTTDGRMLYASVGAVPGTISVILRSDDLVSGLAIDRPSGVGFDYQLSDDGSHHIHDLLMDTGSTTDDGAVYLDGALIARESFPSGAGDNWDNFDAMSINNAGDYLFSGDTDGATTSDEFIAYNGAITLREGDTIGGITLTSSASVNAASLNNLNHAAHLWTYSGGEGLFFTCDAADLAGSVALLVVGDEVDLDGNGTGDATVTDFNASGIIGPGLWLAEDGQVYAEVDLDYGQGDLEAIIAVDAPACGGIPGITLTKTVGTDPNVCAATSNITVPVGSDVTYCYEVTNTGTVTLTVHDLTDNQIGDILTGFAYTLDPGASVAVTETTNIVTDTVNVADWTACNIDGPPTDCTDPAAFDVVTATATANVTVEFVPDIAISKSPDFQQVTNNGIADFTITVTNTGSMALENVTVSDALAPGCDSAVGPLAAGATTSYICSDPGSTSSYTNTAVVTSTLPTGAPGPSASDDAFVEVVEPTGVALSGFGPAKAAAPLWLAALLLLFVAAGALLLRRKPIR